MTKALFAGFLLVLGSLNPLQAQQAALVPFFPSQFLDNSGNPISGGKICTYKAGTSTTLATYTDSTGATPNANPVILDSAGRANLWLGPAAYKLVLRTAGSDATCATGTVLKTVDNVLVNVAQWISAQAYGAKCDGTTDDTTAITNSIAAAVAAGKELAIEASAACVTGAQTISSAIRIRGPGTLKRKTGVSSAILTIAANDVKISGLTLDGNSQGTNLGAILAISSSARFDFSENYIKGAVAGEFSIHATSGLTYSKIAGNKIVSGGSSILIQDNSFFVVVQGNAIDETSAGDPTKSLSAMAAQLGTSESNTIHDITFSGNTVKEAYHFCGEAGNFVSAATLKTQVYNILFIGNTCSIANSTATAACHSASGAACGGFSLSLISSSAVNDNTYNASGQVASIGGVELTSCTGCTAVGNTIIGDTSSAIGQGSRGISVACSQCVISGNKINGMSQGATGFVGAIDVHTTSANLASDDNVIVGNSITLQSGIVSTTGGVYLNCNTAGGSLQRNTIVGNTVVGPGGTGRGVFLQQNSGTCTFDAPTITNNSFFGLGTGVNPATGVISNILLAPNQFSTVTTKIGTGGTPSYRNIYQLSNTSFNKSTDPSYPIDVSGDIALDGVLRNSGTSQLTGSTYIGGQVAATQKLDVHGTSSFTDTMCLSPNHTCNTGSTGLSSPILELDAPGNARFRMQITGGNSVNLDSVDSVPIRFRTAGNDRLVIDTTNGLITSTGYSFQLPSGAFSGFSACNSTFQGAIRIATDSNTNTWGAAIANGGANVVLAYCDGTSWTVAGK